MPFFVSIGSACMLKCSAEAPVSPEFGIDEEWVSKHTGFCACGVLSSSPLPTPPSFAAPWQQKVPEIHQSALASELLLPAEIILALVVLIPQQIRTKCQSAESLWNGFTFLHATQLL